MNARSTTSASRTSGPTSISAQYDMKLVTKMTLAIVAAMTLVVVVYATISIRVHRQQLLDDIHRDNIVMARIVADGVATAYRYGGGSAARAFVEKRSPEFLGR